MDKSFDKSMAKLPVKQSPVAAAETENISYFSYNFTIKNSIDILYNGVKNIRIRLITFI